MPIELPLKALESTLGKLVSRPKDVQLPKLSDQLIGAGVQFCIATLDGIVNELEMGLHSERITPETIAMLQLYFGLPQTALDSEKLDLVKGVHNVFKLCYDGFLADMPEIEIVDADPELAKSYAGYVRGHPKIGVEKGARIDRGRIHIALVKVMSPGGQYLMLGAPVLSSLILHEATHRYAKTSDLIGEIEVPKMGLDKGTEKTAGYMAIYNGTNLIQDFIAKRDSDGIDKARLTYGGRPATVITMEQGLDNADSYAYFFVGMIQHYRYALRLGFSGRRETFRHLSDATGRFEFLQKKIIPEVVLPHAKIFQL